jgi:hypothetical protein
MPKLNDTQSVLLSNAAKRDALSLHPLPEGVKPDGARVTKAIAALIQLGLLEERETSDTSEVARTDGDHSFGLFVTPAGLTALGITPKDADAGGDEDAGAEAEAPAPSSTPAAAPAAPAPKGKTALVLELLGRPGGATIAELTAATGWLPHSMRAALTGLRKKGHAVVRGTRDDATCYTIEAAA